MLHYKADGPGSLSWSEAPDPSLLSHFLTFGLVTPGDPHRDKLPQKPLKSGSYWYNSEGWQFWGAEHELQLDFRHLYLNVCRM